MYRINQESSSFLWGYLLEERVLWHTNCKVCDTSSRCCARRVPASGVQLTATIFCGPLTIPGHPSFSAAFLRWRGQQCDTFNVGAKRRLEVKDAPQDSSFFDPSNDAAARRREALALDTLHSALAFLDSQGGDVAILDATNTTRARRRTILQQVHDAYCDKGVHHRPLVLFVESICNDETVLSSNMLQKVMNSPDYAAFPSREAALADLQQRIAEYQKVYEHVDDSEDATSPMGPISYIKLIDLQSKVICRNISGGLAFIITQFLMVIHIGARPIWLVRAGQCTDDGIRAMIKRGGDAVEGELSRLAASNGGGDDDPAPSARGNSVGRGPPLVRTRSTGTDTVVHSDTGGQAYHSLDSLLPPSLVPPSLSSFASSALSAGLTLNENGRAFGAMLSEWVARRVGGGTRIGHGHRHDATHGDATALLHHEGNNQHQLHDQHHHPSDAVGPGTGAGGGGASVLLQVVHHLTSASPARPARLSLQPVMPPRASAHSAADQQHDHAATSHQSSSPLSLRGEMHESSAADNGVGPGVADPQATSRSGGGRVAPSGVHAPVATGLGLPPGHHLTTNGPDYGTPLTDDSSASTSDRGRGSDAPQQAQQQQTAQPKRIRVRRYGTGGQPGGGWSGNVSGSSSPRAGVAGIRSGGASPRYRRRHSIHAGRSRAGSAADHDGVAGHHAPPLPGHAPGNGACAANTCGYRSPSGTLADAAAALSLNALVSGRSSADEAEAAGVHSAGAVEPGGHDGQAAAPVPGRSRRTCSGASLQSSLGSDESSEYALPDECYGVIVSKTEVVGHHYHEQPQGHAAAAGGQPPQVIAPGVGAAAALASQPSTPAILLPALASSTSTPASHGSATPDPSSQLNTSRDAFHPSNGAGRVHVVATRRDDAASDIHIHNDEGARSAAAPASTTVSSGADDQLDRAQPPLSVSPPSSSQSSSTAAGTTDELLVFEEGPAIFTSLLPRTIETVEGLSSAYPITATVALNPMSTGIAMGVPLQHLKESFPDEWRRFQEAGDKVHHRVTGGESLADVVARLQPLVIEIEREKRPVLIVSHLSTLQVLYAYFKSLPLSSCPDIQLPMNQLIEFSPHQYGWVEKRFTFTRATAEETITHSYHVVHVQQHPA